MKKQHVWVGLSGVDWKQLRKQKKMLAYLAYNAEVKEECDGLLNFLDALMDQAEKTLGSRKVFGNRRPV